MTTTMTTTTTTTTPLPYHHVQGSPLVHVPLWIPVLLQLNALLLTHTPSNSATQAFLLLFVRLYVCYLFDYLFHCYLRIVREIISAKQQQTFQIRIPCQRFVVYNNILEQRVECVNLGHPFFQRSASAKNYSNNNNNNHLKQCNNNATTM
jgi:hypothetical protein